MKNRKQKAEFVDEIQAVIRNYEEKYPYNSQLSDESCVYNACSEKAAQRKFKKLEICAYIHDS